MRITNIDITNYRQYKSLSFAFPSSNDSDIHIIVAQNGIGKTNLLNAITWCLYGKEPHLGDNIRFDERIERTSLFEKFIRDCPDYKKYSRKWFKTRLQAYCDYKGYNYSEGRSSIERYIYITNPLEQKETVNIEKNDVQIEIPF